MVANGGNFTFSFIHSNAPKTAETPINIGFFGFFVYCYLLTISLKGYKFHWQDH